MTLRADLAKLVPKYFAAVCALTRSQGAEPDDSFEEAFGGPCSAAAIAALEKTYELPPSYRAFLSLYGNREGACPTGGILGPRDHRDAHIKKTLRDKSALFDDDDPIAAGAIPLIAGDSRKLVLFVPPRRKDGEMDVVDFDITQEMSRAKNLVAFFRAELAKTERLVAKIKPKKRSAFADSARGAVEALLVAPVSARRLAHAKGWLSNKGAEVLRETRSIDEARAMIRALDAAPVSYDGTILCFVASAHGQDRNVDDAIRLEIQELLFTRPTPTVGRLPAWWRDLAMRSVACAKQAKQPARAKRWAAKI